MSTPDINPLLPGNGAASETPALPLPPPREIPEDIRVPWGWTDLLFFLMFAMGSYILLSILLIVGFMVRNIHAIDELQKAGPVRSLFAVLSTVLFSAALLGYLYLTTRIRFRAPFWRTLGWRPFDSRLPRGLLYAACVAGGGCFAIMITLASAAIGKKAKLPIENFFQDRQSVFLVMALGILIAPFVEETIFRGYLYPLLARSFGVSASVLVTGTLFGLLHAGQLWGGWGQIALLVVVGIVFTYVRAAARTVLASYLLHVSYNTYLFSSLYFATSGFRHLPSFH